MSVQLKMMLAAALLGSACLPTSGASAATLSTLYSFGAKRRLLAIPLPGLVHYHGHFFGTADGGKNQAPPGVFKLFPKAGKIDDVTDPDSDGPYGGLAILNGVIYGTTAAGDTGPATIFALNPLTLALTTVYEFPSGQGFDLTGLVVIGGLLYGSTETGGANNEGEIFQFDPSTNAVTVLHSQTLAEGGYLQWELSTDGTVLYGAARVGGANNKGTLFSLDPATDVETTLYSFGDPHNGAEVMAHSALTPAAGKLFGESYDTDADSYNVYSFNLRSGHMEVVQNLQSIDGVSFGGYVFKAGLLYGTLAYEKPAPYGTLFTIDLHTKALQTLHTFTAGADGAYPNNGLLYYDHAFYGTTAAGGAYGRGTFFKLVP